MPQVLSLSAPIAQPAPPATQTYSIVRLTIERLPAPRLSVVVTDNNGAYVGADYAGATATQIISALNTADLTVKSLQQRVLERLVADGKLPAGNVTGIAD